MLMRHKLPILNDLMVVFSENYVYVPLRSIYTN